MADPSQMPASATPAPGADAGDGSDADSSALFVIEITALQDGTFSVEMESGSQEEGEESGDGSGGEGSESSEPGAQTAQSWSDALQIANEMYEQQAGGDDQSKQAGFDQVFGKGAGAAAGQ